MSKYYPPTYQSEQFHCPYCYVYASQRWRVITYYSGGYQPITINEQEVKCSVCSHCEKPTFWLNQKIFFPASHMAPPINNDLPDTVKEIYNEAANIIEQSPRAACALLRLTLQVLLEHLGKTGNLNTNISKLVKEGLDQQIQQTLDIVRVTGNHAVHPGEIIFNDNTNVQALFQLINVIADAFITQPKRTQEMYDNLPEKDKKAIEKRDETAP